MRHTLPTAALLCLLLTACASKPNAPIKAVDQSGALKVHPGLLGQPVPPELQPIEPAAPKAVPAPAAPAVQEGPRGKAGEQKPVEAKPQADNSIYFDINSAELKSESGAGLQAHADRLLQNPDARVRIEGNADERGPADHNRKLGLKRAEAVKQFLLGRGVAAKQVKAVSLGAANPKRKGHDEESWAENRRADIVYDKKD